MPYVYKITNDVNGKQYIGKTMNTPEKRFAEHCSEYNRPRCEKRPQYSAMKKYGIEHFGVETIEECSIDDVANRERHWIEYYGSFKYGYNATTGGDGKPYVDYDMIVKLFESGNNMSEIQRITGYGEDAVRNALDLAGISAHERRIKCSQYICVAVKMIDPKTNQVLRVFPKIIDAYNYLGKKKSTHIQEVCKGKRKLAYGYKWEYLK